MTRNLLFFLFFLYTAAGFAQSSVTGKLLDKNDHSPLIGASVLLLNIPDSSLYKGVTADLDGNFTIEQVTKGNYILKISYVGYDNYIRNVSLGDTPLDLTVIALGQSGKTLKTVTIADKAPTAIQNGDTTQYNASSYKTNPDANAEDLVTKMSGITTNPDGSLQAHGEDVKKVLVDGKPFFGDDPSAVLKNLPADVIDKIQVFDDQSDQSKFTGINDGNTTKTINIITKTGMRNGTFGKVYAGYGYDDVYRAGGNINFFNGNRRISIVAQSNNVNEQNFSTDDLAGVASSSGGGGGGRGGRGAGGGAGMMGGGGQNGGGGSTNNFLVNAKNGISKTNAIGLNYSDKWGKKITVTGSYFFNWADNTADQTTNRRYLPLSDTGQVYNENSLNESKNINHRVNLRLEWKIDTSNSIIFTPKFSLQQNNGTSYLTSENDLGGRRLNNSNSNYKSNTDAYSFSDDLLYQHKFHKTGRTFSIDLNTAYNGTDAGSNLNSSSYYYSDTTTITSILDQQSKLTKAGSTLGANVVYTEPLSTKSILQFNYSNAFNQTKNDKNTYNYSALDDAYSNLDTTLSNVFKSNYTTQRAGLGYRFNNTKVQLYAGVNYQYATLQSDQTFPYASNINRNYQNILPNAMARINFSKSKSLRIMYRTQTVQPSIDQLQNVLNNSNPTQLSIGNPDLKQDYENTLFLRYSSTNTDKATSFFIVASGTYTDDYIANSSFTAIRDTVRDGITLLRGTQLTRPVNVNGYMNTRLFITYGFPLSFIKSNLNVNGGASFSRTPGIVNDEMNYSNGQTYGGGLTLSSNVSKQVDFTISTNASYNTVENTINKQSNTQYYNQTSKAKLNLIFFGNHVVFATDITNQFYKGLTAGYNQNYWLWNAGLGYKFLKNQQAEIRLTVNDILGQNTSITRNTTETYIEDVHTNLLQRYYMLTFTYNIKSFKAAAPPPGSDNGNMPGEGTYRHRGDQQQQ